MPRSSSRNEPFDPLSRWALGVLGALWVLAVFTGGSARPDVLLVAALRAAAVLGIAALLLVVPPRRFAEERRPLIFAGVAALLVAVQLVPLPHGIWTALPGRAIYDQLSSVSEIGPDIWRPISLSPDLTWNTLLSVLPPLCFLLGAPLLGARHRKWALLALLATIALSGLLGMLQLAGGASSGLRWYRVDNADSAVGFFANRNHEAVFLAMGIPLTAWWALTPSAMNGWMRAMIAACLMAYLFIAVAASQSRMGLLVAGGALLFCVPFALKEVRIRRKYWPWLGGGFVVCVAAAGAVASMLSQRISTLEVEDDLRVRIFAESIEAIKAFFPVGSGFGSFGEVFRRFESVEDLRPTYVNHTHSEITNLLIEGGLPVALLAIAFCLWFGIVTWKAWRAPSGAANMTQRLLTLLVAIGLAGSVTDYPLRAPLMACAFVACAAMLRRGAHKAVSRRGERVSPHSR